MSEDHSSHHVSKDAQQILDLLPSDGRALGNTSLARKLKISKKELIDFRIELIKKGLARASKGRGGGTRRILEQERLKEIEAQEKVESLQRTTTRAVSIETKLRKVFQERSWINFENYTWLLIRNLRPTHITTQRDPAIHTEKNISSPDIVAVFEKWGLIVECKETDNESYQLEGLETLREARSALKVHLKEKFSVDHVLGLLAVRDLSEVTKKVATRAKELRIPILDTRLINYFRRLEKEAGVGMWHMFWGRLFPSVISPDNVKTPALRMKIGKGRVAYLFTANAHDVLVRAFISHRELHRQDEESQDFEAYQRMLKKSRLSDIQQYLEEFHTFPTPIVVSFEERAGHRFDLGEIKEDLGDLVRVGILQLPLRPASIQVIDGQHRLFGFSRVKPSPKHMIHVIAYEKPMARDAAELFVDINSKQKAVPKNLLWELYPEIYDETDSEFYKAIVSRVVEQLVRKKLKKLVTHISTGSKGPITFNTLCDVIVRQKLIAADGGLVGQISADDPANKERYLFRWMETLFDVIAELEEDFSAVNREFVYSNVGIIPVIRVFSRILQHEQSVQGISWLKNRDGIRTATKTYLNCIYDYYSRKTAGELRQLRKARVAEAGFGETEEEMANLIRFNCAPEFPCPGGSSSEITRAADEIALAMNQINRRCLTSGKIKEWAFPSFDFLLFRKKFQGIEFNQDSFAAVLNLLYQELIEGGGGKESSRITQLLGVKNTSENLTLRMLDNLRNYWDHNLRVLKPEKRQEAIGALKALIEKSDLADVNEMSPDDFKKAAVQILVRIRDDVVKVALQALK